MKISVVIERGRIQREMDVEATGEKEKEEVLLENKRKLCRWSSKLGINCLM